MTPLQEVIGTFGPLVLGALVVIGVAVYIRTARRTTDAADTSEGHWRYRKP